MLQYQDRLTEQLRKGMLVWSHELVKVGIAIDNPAYLNGRWYIQVDFPHIKDVALLVRDTERYVPTKKEQKSLLYSIMGSAQLEATREIRMRHLRGQLRL